MAEKVKGLIEMIKDEGRIEGRAEGMAEGMAVGKKNIISRILNDHSVEETAEILKMDEREILRIMDK